MGVIFLQFIIWVYSGPMKILTLAFCCTIAACAVEPPPQPPQRTAQTEITEADIDLSLEYTARAGGDVYERSEELHLEVCLKKAQKLPAQADQSAAIAQCRIDWPLRPAVTINNR
jgi:hypothetical protein